MKRIGTRRAWIYFSACAAIIGLGQRTWADSLTLDSESATFPDTNDVLFDHPGTGGVPGTPPPPAVGVIGTTNMGLNAADVLHDISDGKDHGPIIYFSVDRASVGAVGSGVAAEVASDTAPGMTDHAASDLFITGANISSLNSDVLAPATMGWTLGTTTGDEANVNLVNPTDNVVGYDVSDVSAGGPIYFTLAAGSPTLTANSWTPADVLVSNGGVISLYASHTVLGLTHLNDEDTPDDVIDGLAVDAATSTVVFSLTTASAADYGFSGADILIAGPSILYSHTAVGLLSTDELDALDLIPEPATVSLLALGCFAMLRRRRSV